MPLPSVAACVNCNTSFPPNHELATIPNAHRVAFDVERQRVWRVCSHCQHWNLLGYEASVAAIPELQARFGAGLIQRFDGMELSGMGTPLELIPMSNRLATKNAAASASKSRNDLARKSRKNSLDQLTWLYIGIFWLNLLAWLGVIGTNLVGIFIASGPSGVRAVVGILVLWLVMIGVGSTVWRRYYPGSTSLFVPWRQPDRLGQLVNGGAVVFLLYELTNTFQSIALHGITAHSFSGLFVMIGAIAAIVMNANSRNGRTPSKRQVIISSLVSALAFLGALGTLAWGGSILWIALPVGFFLVMGTITALFAMRYAFKIDLPSGRRLALRGKAMGKLQYSWLDTTQEFQVHDLPDNTALRGADAVAVMRKVLRLMHRSGLAPGTTDRAWEFMRAVGDGPGILGALEGYRDDADGRFSLHALPLTYRLALDFVLADRAGAPKQFAELRDAADAASEVAGEAEVLDRELLSS